MSVAATKPSCMTPYEIEVLIHFHCSSAPHPRQDSRFVREAIARMLGAGLLEVQAVTDHQATYRISPRGSAHIQQLCMLPWPEQCWIDRHGERIA